MFNALGKNMNYEYVIQLDGAYSVTHINTGESPIFNHMESKNIASESRVNSISTNDSIEGVLEKLELFDGTEKNYTESDRIKLWGMYWEEYINAFDKLTEILPDSIVTIYVGRQAIELGIKFLLLKKTGEIDKIHDLSKLIHKLYDLYDINFDYMEFVDSFCDTYSEYIEGNNVEYFRFPEYKNDAFFAGNRLSIRWISFNFALIILKLLHFAELEEKFGI